MNIFKIIKSRVLCLTLVMVQSFLGLGFTTSQEQPQEINSFLGLTSVEVAKELALPKSTKVSAIIPKLKYIDTDQPRIDKINEHIGGKLKGYGQFIFKECTEGKVKVEPELVTSVIQHETGNGTSSAILSLNNPGGLMNPRTDRLYSFINLEEGLHNTINLLKQYKVKGLITIPQIQPIYCPVGADNDPSGLNHYWLSGVTEYYRNLKK